MIRFFREQKILTALLVLSFLVIVAGLLMVNYTNKNISTVAAQEVEQVQGTVSAMHTIARIAEEELQASKVTAAEVGSFGDIKPQESLDRVAALNGRIPDVGTDDWCEVMMVKDANAWTKEEQALFAQHCI